MFIVTVRRYKF